MPIQYSGAVRTMLAAVGLLATGYGLSTIASLYWHFVVLWGVVVGLGSGMVATVLGAAVVNRWFTARRGVVMGVLTASTATGQLIFLPWLAQAVEAQGWRTAMWIVAGAAAVIAPLIWMFMRDQPADVGQRRYGESREEPAEPTGPSRAVAPANPAVLASARWVRPSACAFSGCSPDRSSSAARAPTDSSGPI